MRYSNIYRFLKRPYSQILLSIAALLITVFAWNASPAYVTIKYTEYFLTGFLISALLALPTAMGLLTLAILTLIYISIYTINYIKIQALNMPLTTADIVIAIKNPVGLLNALGWGKGALFGLYALGFALLAIMVVMINRSRFSWFGSRAKTANTFASIAILAVLVPTTGTFSSSFASAIKSTPEYRLIWNPNKIADASKQIGLVPFLILSYFAQQEFDNEFLSDSFDAQALPAGVYSSNAASYIKMSGSNPDRSHSLAPNIVLIHAESTFNPNMAFRLETPVKSPLFLPHTDTRLVGQFAVNTTGGGSWVTEFESVIGLDSRFFGYLGFYTHTSLSPLMKQSFATYLKAYGYDSYVYYSVPGDFYNARDAYRKYGFENFYDSRQLGFGEGEWVRSDQKLLSIARADLAGRDGSSPFFAFVVTSENHSPHPCRNFQSRDQFISRFVAKSDFDTECQLNEYLLRLKDTEIAYMDTLEFMKELERKTGRPYVVMVYGDHQPHTFVTVSSAFSNFSKYQTETSVYETAFQLNSSVPGRHIDLEGSPLPAALTPTVLSAFMAPDLDSLYLPENFYLFAKCGYDFFPKSKARKLFSKARTVQTEASVACRQARYSVWASYRRKGMFGNNGPRTGHLLADLQSHR